MNKFSLGLTALFMAIMVIIMAPNVLALNRGRVLRNIAIWLAVIVGLTLFYQAFGPGSSHSLFKRPAIMTNPDETVPAPPAGSKGNNDKSNKSFTPPDE